MVDNISGTSFLVDTGSSFSIIPFKSPSSPTGPRLRAANGQQIPCWGKRQLTMAFGGRRFSWYFLLAAVDFHIIGVDFLKHFKLSVDVTEKTLREQPNTTDSPIAAVTSTSSPSASSPSTTPPSRTTEEKALLADFSSVLNEEGRLPPTTHGVEHHIVTSGRPVTAKFRRLDNIKLAAAKEEFHRLESEGIIRRSNSDWASPLHMVQKSDGSWRPCGDYRRLNIISETDCYPLPNMADITSSLAGARIFSKLDLKKGYHQIPVHPADVKKTAIITPFGLFEFIRMLFGLKNTGMTFQRFMDRALAGLPFILIYLDDILIASAD